MIIGLLEAETLPAKVVERFGSYGDMFERLLAPLGFQFKRFAADCGELPRRTDECDAYIVTGSRHNAYDRDPWIEALKDLVRSLDAEQGKCLGICFGHQLVAEALGGKVEKSSHGWGVGMTRFQVEAQPTWMHEPPAAFSIRVSHQDQVTALPPRARRFASSDFCPNGGYFIGDHIFCLQGHPEFSRDYIAYLMEKRAERIGEPRLSDARASLQENPSSDAFLSWMGDFFGK